jgi:RHS repeat-associated protein
MLTSTTSPLAHGKTITRNALGLPVTIVDEDGNETTHTYNARNWPVVSTYRFPGGALREEITRTFDGVGNVLTIESATTGIREEFRYAPITGPDPHTLHLREVIWKRSGVFWKAVESDPDANGNLVATRIREAGGTITHSVEREYDDSDRLTAIKVDGVLMAVQEYEHGFHVKTTFPQTGNTILRYYRENGRLRVIAHLSAAGQVLAQVEYTEDGRQRREEVFHAHLDVKSTYTYTDNSWLATEQHVGPAGGPTWTNTEAAQPGGNAAAPTTGAAVTPNPPGATVSHQRANTYDLRGNRTLAAGPGWNQVMQYDPEDRLFFEQRNGQPIQYTYENRGCLATKNAAGQLTTFENDYLGRMTGYQTATAHVRDTYAPTGQRIAHIDQLGVAPEEWYLPDGLETLADYTKQGANPEQFDGIYAASGLDGKAARVGAGGQAQYYFQDALGSVGQVVDATGAVVRTNFTDAWGANLAVGLPAPPVGLGGRWGYTGREKDEVSGLMHYRARTYDPAVGRFVSRDPVRTWNLYWYVFNQPTFRRDPRGTWPEWLDNAVAASGLVELLDDESVQAAGEGFVDHWVSGGARDALETAEDGFVAQGKETLEALGDVPDNLRELWEDPSLLLEVPGAIKIVGEGLKQRGEALVGTDPEAAADAVGRTIFDAELAAVCAKAPVPPLVKIPKVPTSLSWVPKGGSLALAGGGRVMAGSALAIEVTTTTVSIPIGLGLRVRMLGGVMMIGKGGPTPGSLPFKGSPGSVERLTDGAGRTKQIRRYGSDGYPEVDVDFTHDHGQGVPHAHDWGRPPDGSPPSAADRGVGRPVSPADPK